MKKEFKNFEEFYPYYIDEHKSKYNKLLHFIGTTIFFIFMIIFIVILYLGNLHIWINALPYGNNYFTNTQHFIRFLLQLVLIYVTYIIYKYG